MASEKFNLDKEDLKKWGLTALDAAIGAVLTVVANVVVPDLQTNGQTGVLVASALTIAVNLIRRWLQNNKTPSLPDLNDSTK